MDQTLSRMNRLRLEKPAPLEKSRIAVTPILAFPASRSTGRIGGSETESLRLRPKCLNKCTKGTLLNGRTSRSGGETFYASDRAQTERDDPFTWGSRSPVWILDFRIYIYVQLMMKDPPFHSVIITLTLSCRY